MAFPRTLPSPPWLERILASGRRLLPARLRGDVPVVPVVRLSGTIGYEILGMLQPDFYYAGAAAQNVRNLWFAIDGAFLTLYAAGCLVFLYIVVGKTSYAQAVAAV